jgi:hypothetical protein
LGCAFDYPVILDKERAHIPAAIARRFVCERIEPSCPDMLYLWQPHRHRNARQNAASGSLESQPAPGSFFRIVRIRQLTLST